MNFFELFKVVCFNDFVLYLVFNKVGLFKKIEIFDRDFVEVVGIVFLFFVLFDVELFGILVNNG